VNTSRFGLRDSKSPDRVMDNLHVTWKSKRTSQNENSVSQVKRDRGKSTRWSESREREVSKAWWRLDTHRHIGGRVAAKRRWKVLVVLGLKTTRGRFTRLSSKSNGEPGVDVSLRWRTCSIIMKIASRQSKVANVACCPSDASTKIWTKCSCVGGYLSCCSCRDIFIISQEPYVLEMNDLQRRFLHWIAI
jgi:hypothetical protein